MAARIEVGNTTIDLPHPVGNILKKDDKTIVYMELEEKSQQYNVLALDDSGEVVWELDDIPGGHSPRMTMIWEEEDTLKTANEEGWTFAIDVETGEGTPITYPVTIDGQTIELPHPVRKRLDVDGITVILMEVERGIGTSNIVAYGDSGTEIWRIDNGDQEEHLYTGLYWGDNHLVASTYDGTRYNLEPNTGEKTFRGRYK